MFVPRQNPHFYQHQEKTVEQRFSLLCWNIHKENTTPHFQSKLHELLHTHPSDFLLFQEYKMPKYQSHDLSALSYAMAANIETKRHIYGLMTASYSSFDTKHIELTHQKEFLISTRKSTLLTSHSFFDGKVLHLLNMHGINFVSSKVFNKELEKIKLILSGCSGALIVCGDFNNWSNKRIKVLEEFQADLSLKQAVIEEGHHIKHVFSKPIDHIFYRDLKLIKAEAINTKKISDHNPIHAIFERI
jgi:endonuclease/exonuclease/phosphatase (EEP) superfamily protein YafD